jgi:RimJ/RimL family protein N-acetyltransferase
MGDKIKLRFMTKADTAISWQWRNQQPVKDHFSGHPFDVSKEQEEEWFERAVEANESHVVFTIVIQTSDTLAGLTFLKQINTIHRQAEFAILIDEKYSGMGIGSEACYKTLDYAFRELGLHRVWLKVREDNIAAIKIYERCGFRMEGLLRDDVFKQGSFRNQLIMSVLEGEFTGKN